MTDDRCPSCGCPRFPHTLHRCPPLVRGGQGRTDFDVKVDGTALLFTLIGLLALGLALLVRGCSR